MSGFWLGLLVIPALVLAGAAIWLAYAGAAHLYFNYLDPSLRDGRKAHAYQVKTASGYLADKLIGATFIEPRYRGKKYTYRVQFNGVEQVSLMAVYKGTGLRLGSYTEWEPSTAEELDKTPGGSDRP